MSAKTFRLVSSMRHLPLDDAIRSALLQRTSAFQRQIQAARLRDEDGIYNGPDTFDVIDDVIKLFEEVK